jgi:uncharacterized membrane protein YraQ (UPF0718 family)
MLVTSSSKKRAVGLILFAIILALFFTFNRFPKLDAVGVDLDIVSSPEVQCFQGFCIERDPGTGFLSQWWTFSLTYFRLVAIGMTFAFLVAGLAEAFLFTSARGAGFQSGGMFRRTLKGMAAGPVMNLCSACIVPVSAAFRKRAGIEGAIAMVQGSATMNIPALAMVFFVFTPLLGFSRLVLAVVGALIIGPLVVMTLRKEDHGAPPPVVVPVLELEEEAAPWGPVLREAFVQWARTTAGYVVRMGPIMLAAGLLSGLVIQWISPDTVSDYLGNDIGGVAIAATVGVLINVPLLFEIPLVALLLTLGMGTAPAATLLFAAAAGGPVTFWGLAKVMPRRAVAAFATATWGLGVLGGVGMLVVGAFIWDDVGGLKTEAAVAPEVGEPASFTDATEAAGVAFAHQAHATELFPLGGGALVIDFNGDGLHDLYVVNSVGPNALYRNNGDSTFTDVAVAAGVGDATGRGNGGCAADYDNDGDQDLFVTNFGPSRLFRNDGGSFTDVTVSAGVRDSADAFRTTGCAWGDYDQDGFVDLIAVRHLYEDDPRMFDTKEFEGGIGGIMLYRNQGDGTFAVTTHLLGTTPFPIDAQLGAFGNIWGAGFQPGWSDLDNDGDLDLYIVNDLGADIQSNVLWRNDGPAADGSWSFTDVSLGSGANQAVFGMGLAIGDYNLDGFLDIFVTNIRDSLLLKNEGAGLRFTSVARDAGARFDLIGRKARVAWGAIFFDYDNDGDEDLYVVSGHLRADEAGITAAANPEQQPNVLLRNEGDGTFANVSSASGADDSGIGRGAVYLDYDNDGCLDVFVVNLGQPAKLLLNLCETGRGWITVKTVGTSSNRDGIGARVTIEVAGMVQIREITAGASQMGQNMLEAHFGLGAAGVVDSVTVRWPSGKVQRLTNVPANQRIIIVEPAD